MAMKTVGDKFETRLPPASIEMDLSKDNRINVADLHTEFQIFPSSLFAYCEAKSSAEQVYDLLKQQLEELEAETYIAVKNSGEKVTEKGAESLVTVDPAVKAMRVELINAKRDLETMKNYVESLRAKKDMLIQLGADARKE